jgi:hypothetical protein
MRLPKITKQVLACGLALSLVVTGGNTSVFAKAAKKPSLNKKKVSVTVGKTTKLKVKKAKKKVKWSTSNKKIVKVTKTSGSKKSVATLKGVKAGTAKVTAKVGSKKLTCKVTVKAPATNIKTVSVDPLDSTCLVVTLKKAAAVNVSDLTISKKYYDEGTYNYQPTVKTLTTTDQVTYRIYLSSSIYNGDYVKVALSAKDYLETQYKATMTGEDDDQILLEKEQNTVTYCSDFFQNGVGTSKYVLAEGALPTGLELKSKRGLIKGIPTAVGSYPVTIKATDELGRSATAKVTFMVYDKTTIVSKSVQGECALNDYVDEMVKKQTTATAAGSTEIYTYKSYTIAPAGGSGLYKFALTGSDTTGVSLSTDIKDDAGNVVNYSTSSSTTLQIPYNITDGTHVFTVQVTDAFDASIQTTATVTVDAVRMYNVSGTAKDVNGASLSGNRVYIYPVDATSADDYIPRKEYIKDSDSSDGGYWEDQYYSTQVGSSETSTTLGEMKGSFATELAAGEYIVKVQSDVDGIKYQMSDTITITAADNAVTQIVVPVRFYSVLGQATYQNGTAITNEMIYFETKEGQYENSDSNWSSGKKFYVKTNDQGAFVASLPANTYVAYVNDNGTRRYFNADITITDQDVTLNSFQLDITRYSISGVVKSNETDLVKNTDLVFIAPDGEIYESETDSTGAFSVKLPGAAAPGVTYTVRYYSRYSNGTSSSSSSYYYDDDDDDYDYSYSTPVATAIPSASSSSTLKGSSYSDYSYNAAEYKTLTPYSGGQVTSVTVVEGQQAVQGLELRYDFAQTVAGVTNVAAAGATVDIVADRVADAYAKIDITQKGRYSFEFGTGNTYEKLSDAQIVIFSQDGTVVKKNDNTSSSYSYYGDDSFGYNSSSYSTGSITLDVGTYYIKMVPLRRYSDNKVQQPGTYKLTVTAEYLYPSATAAPAQSSSPDVTASASASPSPSATPSVDD